MPRARGRRPRANNRVPYNMRQRNRVEGNDQPPIQQQQPEQPVIQPVAQPIAIQPEQPQVQHPDVQQNVQQPHSGELLNLNANINNAPLMIPMSNELRHFCLPKYQGGKYGTFNVLISLFYQKVISVFLMKLRTV